MYKNNSIQNAYTIVKNLKQYMKTTKKCIGNGHNEYFAYIKRVWAVNAFLYNSPRVAGKIGRFKAFSTNLSLYLTYLKQLV